VGRDVIIVRAAAMLEVNFGFYLYQNVSEKVRDVKAAKEKELNRG
jgi:hypothetical protein